MLSAVSTQPLRGEQKLARLRDIIIKKSIMHGDFKLASGGVSKIYFDMKMSLLDPEGATLAADLILEILDNEKVKVDAVGGLALGACPIVSALCIKVYEQNKTLKTFYVRKDPKEHGTQKLIEGGPLVEGSRVIIVDDVTTAGSSVLRAIKAVRDLHCHVTKVITVVDRLQGAREKLAKERIELVSLLTRDDLPL
jgi:orotate phosphoribosyltransferase